MRVPETLVALQHQTSLGLRLSGTRGKELNERFRAFYENMILIRYPTAAHKPMPGDIKRIYDYIKLAELK